MALAFAGALSFASVEVLLGLVLPMARSAQGAGLTFFFMMFLLSGAGRPRDALSGGMRGVSDALPLTYVVRLLQEAWLDSSWDVTVSLVVLGILVVSSLLAFKLFRWE